LTEARQEPLNFFGPNKGDAHPMTKFAEAKGIILDYAHSVALLDAVKQSAGYSPSMSSRTEEALISLLIFENAEIVKSATQGREEASEKLLSEGVIEFVPKSAFEPALKFVDSYTSNVQIAAKGFSDDGETRTTVSAQEKSIDLYMPFIRANLNSTNILTQGELIQAVWQYCNALPSTDFTDTLMRDMGLHENIDKFGLPLEDDFYTGTRLPELALEDLDDEAKNALAQDSIIAAQVLTAYIQYRGLARRATSIGLPIKSQCAMVETALDKTLGPEASQLFKIHLDEVRVMPYLGSIEDVYRLRGHKHIDNFRSSILEWLERISSGESDIEQKYRQSIRTANNELKKLEKWKYVNSPYTLAASIGVGIAELFTGTPLGILMSAISGAAVVDKVRKEKKFGFAIFPR
jgi:F0F1-type ATP synthase membrane subunit c/vacuolar-type H+-ATPase subunit K